MGWLMLSPRRRPLIRRQIVLCLALALGSSFAGCARQPAPPPRPQRIVLVTIDTLRADHLGLYGYPRQTSPFLDDLATGAVVFEQAFAPTSHTAPSHASLFTGLQPEQHRVLHNGEVMPPTLVTLAESLSRAGYRTGAFPAVRFLSGLAEGFAEFSHARRGSTAEEILRRGGDWLAAAPPAAKSFTWLHLFEVHQWSKPGAVADEDLALVKADPASAGLLDLVVTRHGARPDQVSGDAALIDALDRYDAQIRRVDRALGEFWRGVSALPGETLLVVTADHGEGLGGHGWLGHGRYLYNEQIRVPLLVISSTGRFPPRRLAAAVRLVDLAPTITELAGASLADQPVPLAGASLATVLAGGELEARRVWSQRRPVDNRRLALGWENELIFALQDARHKAIVHSSGDLELFDLGRDPLELENLHEDPPPELLAMRDEAARLYRRMRAEGEVVGGEGGIQDEFIGELEALGYL